MGVSTDAPSAEDRRMSAVSQVFQLSTTTNEAPTMGETMRAEAQCSPVPVLADRPDDAVFPDAMFHPRVRG
eukprot:5879988-Alexandrium_andersonii.AAC.1